MEPKERKEYEEYIKRGIISQSVIDTDRWEAKYEGKIEEKIEERSEAKRDFTISLITNTDFDGAKIAYLIGVDVNWVASIRKELSK